MNVGSIGEDIAADYLDLYGFTIIERNYRWRHGEIDIICEYAGGLVFVEVKTRQTASGGEPYQAVNQVKLNKIRATGLHFAYKSGRAHYRMRIDVISIHIKPDGALDRLKHFQNVQL